MILPCGCGIEANGDWAKICERHQAARSTQHKVVDSNLLRAVFDEAARLDPEKLWDAIRFTEYTGREKDEQAH